MLYYLHPEQYEQQLATFTAAFKAADRRSRRRDRRAEVHQDPFPKITEIPNYRPFAIERDMPEAEPHNL